MAYQTPWNHLRADACRIEAERRVGLSPEGYLYRLEDVAYSTVIDAEREIYGSRDQVELRACAILKRTEKGWRIALGGGNTRFVLERAVKHWASPTLDDALQDYVARKTRAAALFEARASRARRLIELAAGPGFKVGRMVG